MLLRPVRPPNVDDATETARLHVRGHGLGTAEVADHFGVEVRQQLVVAGMLDVIAHHARRRRGTVDQDVDAAEVLVRGGDHFRHGRHIVGVAEQRQYFVAGLRADLFGGQLEKRHAPRADHHLAAFFGQKARNFLADAHATSGDDCHAAFQFQIHSSSSCDYSVQPRSTNTLLVSV